MKAEQKAHHTIDEELSDCECDFYDENESSLNSNENKKEHIDSISSLIEKCKRTSMPSK